VQVKPPLFVLVVGETARGDHFGLNGYGRDTTPVLKSHGVYSWHHAQSCGTSTAASVPCMFSHMGKQGFEARKSDHENLLDVLQAAGLAVLWVDNQGGCKGVCDRVPHASTADAQNTPRGHALCEGGECLDEMLLNGLDARIAQLPAERRARGVVVVLHPIGSHGPAYFKRSDAQAKRFQPECRDIALDRCGQGELVNAFDNSIAYTDRFLGGVIDWLQAREAQHQTAMLYMSDHGESLGEYGIYLHGMPYAFAPDEQKRVAMVLWPGTLARRSGVVQGCLPGQLDAPVTHDSLYPTVLGLLDVQTPTYRPALDALQPCREGQLATVAMK
ncbi:MAG: phosphoethanolamine transferase, partial [Rubrivivax sp.]